jgi:hypothetical protein
MKGYIGALDDPQLNPARCLALEVEPDPLFRTVSYAGSNDSYWFGLT